MLRNRLQKLSLHRARSRERRRRLVYTGRSYAIPLRKLTSALRGTRRTTISSHAIVAGGKDRLVEQDHFEIDDYIIQERTLTTSAERGRVGRNFPFHIAHRPGGRAGEDAKARQEAGTVPCSTSQPRPARCDGPRPERWLTWGPHAPLPNLFAPDRIGDIVDELTAAAHSRCPPGRASSGSAAFDGRNRTAPADHRRSFPAMPQNRIVKLSLLSG